MPGGRPSEYKEEYTQKAQVYLAEYTNLGDAIPTIEGFADYIDVSKKTIYNWCKEQVDTANNEVLRVASDEFLHAIGQIENLQGKILQNKGLLGEFNPTITKLMLSANHDMREKSDLDVKSGGEKLNTFDESQINTIAERIAGRKDSNGSTSSEE